MIMQHVPWREEDTGAMTMISCHRNRETVSKQLLLRSLHAFPCKWSRWPYCRAALTWMLTQRCYNLSVLAAGTEGMKCCREACMLSRATDPPGWRWACCRAALTWTLTQRWHGLDNCDAATTMQMGQKLLRLRC